MNVVSEYNFSKKKFCYDSDFLKLKSFTEISPMKGGKSIPISNVYKLVHLLSKIFTQSCSTALGSKSKGGE